MIDERSHHPPIDPLSHSRHGDSSGPLRKASCVRTWPKRSPGASAPGSSDAFFSTALFWLNTGCRVMVGRTHGAATSKYRWELDRRAGSNPGRTELPKGDPRSGYTATPRSAGRTGPLRRTVGRAGCAVWTAWDRQRDRSDSDRPVQRTVRRYGHSAPGQGPGNRVAGGRWQRRPNIYVGVSSRAGQGGPSLRARGWL